MPAVSFRHCALILKRMDYTHIVIQMLSIFGIVLVGLVAAKRGLWASDMDRKMSTFVLNVSMPALILASVMGDDLAFERSEIVSLLGIAAVNYVLLIGAAWFVPRVWPVGEGRRGILRFMLAFGNVTFIGYPVVDAVFGPRAVFCASVLNLPSNLLMFTLGVSYIKGSPARGAFCPRMLVTPCMIASLAAIAIALFKVSTPVPVANWFHLLGDMTVPCALLIIGSSLSHIPWRDMLGNRFVYMAATLRLIVLPLVVFAVFRLCGFPEFASGIAVVLSAMPVATNGIMFCLQYGRDERVMTQGLFLTTLFSVITIPLLSLLL